MKNNDDNDDRFPLSEEELKRQIIERENQVVVEETREITTEDKRTTFSSSLDVDTFSTSFPDIWKKSSNIKPN